MSYRDPYSSHTAAGAHNQQTPYPQYGESSQQNYSDYPPQQQYNSPQKPEYDPYQSNQDYQGKKEYDDNQNDADYTYGAYDTTYNYPPVQRQATQRSGVSRKTTRPTNSTPANSSGFNREEFARPLPAVPKDRSARAVRAYRYDHQGNLWTKGGRGRCVGRVFCCSLMTFVFLLVSIILALALWIRPPSISIGSVQTITGSNGSPIVQQPDGIQINFAVPISVKNPNYFSVSFKKIGAEIFYPIDNTPIGGGEAANIVIEKTSQTDFNFPFALQYNSTQDPQSKVILDIASKCGVTGGAKTNINVNYKITLGIRILLVTISPVISNQFSFPCPLQASDISKFLGGGLSG